MNRRYFIFSSTALAAQTVKPSKSPNETVRVAVVGCGGRGNSHMSAWTSIPNVALGGLVDVDDSHSERYVGALQKRGLTAPPVFRDIRKVLEDKSIDAVSIATPNHWHALQTIWACQAGKDVYVEKPCSHNIFESRQIVAAARKYNKWCRWAARAAPHPLFRKPFRK
jgi:predicted dehydrogenase